MAGLEKPQLNEVFAALSMLYKNQSRDKNAIETASTYLTKVQQRYLVLLYLISSVYVTPAPFTYHMLPWFTINTELLQPFTFPNRCLIFTKDR